MLCEPLDFGRIRDQIRICREPQRAGPGIRRQQHCDMGVAQHHLCLRRDSIGVEVEVAVVHGTTLEALLPTVDRFGLGTTAVTNTLAAWTGQRLGLITTAGFEDIVPLARGTRVCVDGWLVMPPSLVERDRIVGLDERIDRDGSVIKALATGAA